MQHKQKCASFPPELQVLYDQAKNIPVSAGDAEASGKVLPMGTQRLKTIESRPI